MVFRFASLGNPAVPSGYAGVPSFAFQEPLQVRLMSTEGQPCSLTIPIASIPTQPPFIYLWLQYTFLPHDAFFKLQNLWTWNAGQSLVLSWSWTMRSLFDITSTRERNSSRFSLHDRYAPYGSFWYLNSMEQRCFCSIWTPAPNTTNPHLLVILSNISKTRKC